MNKYNIFRKNNKFFFIDLTTGAIDDGSNGDVSVDQYHRYLVCKILKTKIE